ncbi:MAG: hypothetical protein IH835_00075 [Proteobacteria bacterium]|nr:hypothetical protein [Pseudomonadota bacterium]
MKPSEFCRREVQWLPPGQTLQPEFNTDEITSPEYIAKLGCGIGLAKKRGWRKNEDIHSLHEVAKKRAPKKRGHPQSSRRTVGRQHCHRQAFESRDEAREWSAVDIGFGNRQQRSSGNRISTIAGKFLRSGGDRLGQAQMMLQPQHPALPKMLTISLQCFD